MVFVAHTHTFQHESQAKLIFVSRDRQANQWRPVTVSVLSSYSGVPDIPNVLPVQQVHG